MTSPTHVFVSQPRSLDPRRTAVRRWIEGVVRDAGLEPHTVGVSDHATGRPLDEVHAVARRCVGGLVLGFAQSFADVVRYRPGTDRETVVEGVVGASPWNQLEAGVLVGLGLPLLVVCEAGVSGGVFDTDAGDHEVHRFDLDRIDGPGGESLAALIGDWSQRLRSGARGRS